MLVQRAILTGDLIKSTQASADKVDATMRLLAEVAHVIDDDTRFTRFRGDGWQIYLHNAGDCLWASLFILARLKASGAALSTRISVGIGDVWKLPEGDLSAAAGPAFTASGQELDDMHKGQTLAIRGESVDRFQRRIFAFAEDKVSRWSPEQAEAMALALDPAMNSRATIAKQLGITRQAVEARLVAAGQGLLEEACSDFYEKYKAAPLGKAT
jgi:hypothetical protein